MSAKPMTAEEVEALEHESETIIRTLSGVVESTYLLDVHRTRLALIAYARNAVEDARKKAFEEARDLLQANVDKRLAEYESDKTRLGFRVLDEAGNCRDYVRQLGNLDGFKKEDI